MKEDYTFPVRFKQFLEQIPKDWWMSQPHLYEEYHYMLNTADYLLNDLIKTADTEEKKNYLKNLGLL